MTPSRFNSRWMYAQSGRTRSCAGAARRNNLIDADSSQLGEPSPVQPPAADAVDEVRRSEQRRLASEPEDAKALKGTRYALLKHPARLRPGEARRLETLRRENRALDRAYELKEYLATILGQATPDDAPALILKLRVLRSPPRP